jgi:aspartate-semialdehyde dehydrogenase
MYNVAVVGATGNVGKEIINILAERSFPVGSIVALASSSSLGKKISFGDETLEVQDLAKFDFTGTDFALFSAGSEISARYAIAAAKHAIVIDNTSFFRMQSDVPLVVTGVNDNAIDYSKRSGIIANPNCSVMQMVMALKPLHDFAKIKRIVVTCLQSVSGAGKDAMDELYFQTKAKYEAGSVKPQILPRNISFNLIPQIGDFLSNGITQEEEKIILETKKILDPEIKVSATCVRVPVFIGHSLSVNVEFSDPISVNEASKLLRKHRGVHFVENSKNYICPIDVAGEDDVFVSRLRIDQSKANTLNLWVVADNLRKGAALNAVQIAELIIQNKSK